MKFFYALLITCFFCFKIYSQTIQASGPLTFCVGQNVQLSVNGAASGSTYQWTKDATNITGSTANAYAASAFGSYGVIVRPGTNNIPDTLPPVTVTVNPLPANPAFTFTANNQCASLPFNFSITSPEAGVTYTWDFGDGGTATGANSSHVFNALGNGTQTFSVKVTVKTSAGCTIVSGVQTVTVKQRPDPALFEPSNFRFCGNIGNITPSITDASPQPSSNYNNYEIIWGDVGASYSSAAPPNNATHTYATGTYTLTYNVTGTNGCVGTKKYTVLNITNPRIGAGIPSNTQGCGPKTICFPINEFAENHPTTVYEMDFGDQSPVAKYSHPPPDSVCHTYTTTSCGRSGNQFVFTVRAINGCDISKGEFSPVRVYSKPEVDFDIVPSPGCVNKPITVINNTKEGFNNSCSNSTKYIWDFGDGTAPVVVFSKDDLTHIYKNSGNYSISLLAENGCGTNSNSKPICITNPASPGFTLDAAAGCVPFTVNVTNTTTVPPVSCKNPTYKWDVSYTPAFCGTLSAYTFTNGTSDISENPSLNFISPGTYTLTQNASNVCGTFVTSKIINVKKPSTASITLPAYGCGTVTITPAATVESCNNITPTYNWTFAGGTPATAGTANPGPVTFTTTGDHLITLEVSTDCGKVTATDTVKVTSTPDVVAPPNQTVCGGAAAGAYIFTSTTGTPDYTWTNSNPSIGLAATGTGNIAAFTAINNGSSAVTATITVTPSVSNCTGSAQSFTITVNPRPAPPVVISPIIYCLNATPVALTATASGANTLTWYNNALLTNGSTTAPIPATNAAATVFYYVTQSNGFTCASAAAVIEVKVNPLIAGNSISSNQTICANTAGNAITSGTVSGGNGAYTYQWQSAAGGSNVWSNISGANGNSYLPGILTDTIQYRRIVNSLPCTDTSNIVTINVQGALSNFNIGADQTICDAATPALLIGEVPNGGSGGYTYVWESSVDNINWINTGAAAKDYQPPALNVTTYFRRRVSTTQCTAVSGVVKITVNPTPAGSITAAAQVICVTDAVNVSFTASTGTAPFTAALAITSPVGITDTIQQSINTNGPVNIPVLAAPNSTGIYSIRLIKLTDGKGCERLNIPPAVNIAVLSPLVNSIKNDTIICNGQSASLYTETLQGGAAPGVSADYSFKWEAAAQGSSNWQPVPGGTTASLTVNPSASTCYRRKVKSNNLCEAVSNIICVTVNPGITNNVINSSQQVCVNAAVNNLTGTTPAGGDNNYTYQWQTSTDNSTWINVAATVNYQPPVYAFAGGHYFRRNVSSGSCTAVSNVILITVKPDAKALFTATANTVCAGSDLANIIAVSILPDSNGTYNWYADNNLFGSNNSGIFPAYIITLPEDTVVIKLVTQSPFGCRPDSIEQAFISFKTAVAKFTKGNAKGCGPLTVPFTNTSNIIDNSIRFFWDFGNGITSTDAQPGNIVFNASPYFNDTVYYVSLKAYNGCDTTIWKDSVQVRSNPKARFGLPSTSGCSPFTVQVTNTSLGAPNTYYWNFGNGHLDTTFNTGMLDYTYNIGNAVDTFTLQLIAKNQCGSDTQAIDIRIAPNVISPQVSISSSELYGCSPHIVTFINSTSGASSFTWNFGDGTPVIITGNNERRVLHTFKNPGDFTVQVDITNGCSDTTVFRKITVYPKPKASFTINPVYCLGDTVKVNNSSADATNQRWFWGDGQSDAGINPVHVYNTAGNYDVLLRAERTNNFGLVCFDTLVLPVTVLVRPDVRLQSNISNSNCAPFTLNVSAPGIINENVTWYITDTTVSPSVIVFNGISAQYIFRNAGTFTIKMIAVNALGCTDSTEKIFTVKGTPVAAFTPGNLSACKTDTIVSFVNTTQYKDNGPVNYRWLVNNVQYATSGNFIHQYTAAALLPKVFTTSLIATNSIGCSDTASAVLQLNPLARASFSIINPNNCVPFTPALVSNTAYTSDYKWLLNGQLVSTDATPDIVITQAATAYKLLLVAGNEYGCKPDSFAVNFVSRIKPAASFTVNDTLGCSGVLNVATDNKTVNANLYTWNWGDNTPTNSFKNPTHLYNTLGQYNISLIASDGVCKDTASQAVNVSLKPVVNFSADQTLTCDTARIKFTNLSENADKYIWSFGDGTSSIEVNPQKNLAPNKAPYTIKLVGITNSGCRDSLVKANLILAKVPPAADFFISPNPVIAYPNYTFSFTNLTLNSSKYTYKWDLGDGTFSNTRDIPTHKYADTGNYFVQLIVLDTNISCPDTVIKIARIDGFPGFLYVPNAICPGCIETGLREFIPKAKGLKTYRLQIFTTWGELIFQTTALDVNGSPTQSWNGRYKGALVAQDVYVWRIDARFMNGTEWQGMLYPGEGQYKKTGTITVVR